MVNFFCIKMQYQAVNFLIFLFFCINYMKTSKFRPHLVPKILDGTKTSTWRLFDDKDFHEGDLLELINKENLEVFAKAKIVSVEEKELGELTDEDWVGHDKFESDEEMYSIFSKYYGKEVTPKDKIKIVVFELINN